MSEEAKGTIGGIIVILFFMMMVFCAGATLEFFRICDGKDITVQQLQLAIQKIEWHEKEPK